MKAAKRPRLLRLLTGERARTPAPQAAKRVRIPALLAAYALQASVALGAGLGPEATPREVLDVPEAAALLRVTPKQVVQMAQAHELPGRLIGGRWRFARSGLIAWLGGQPADAAALPADPGAAGATATVAPANPTAPGVPAASVSGPAPQAAADQSAGAATPSAGQGNSGWPRMAIGEIDLASITAAAPEEEVPAAGSAAAPAHDKEKLGVAPASSTAQEVALRDQGALLRRGGGSVELGVFHTHSEQTLMPVVRQEQSSTGLSTTVRYGLADDLQVVAAVPAVQNRTITYTDAAVTGTPQSQGTVEDHVGDASLSLLGVAMREATWRPNLLFSLDTVLPTGPGDRGLGASVIVSKSFDPAVIFGSVSYMQGLSVDAGNAKRSLARHNLGMSLGYTYALNDALAVNSVFSDTWRDAAAPDQTSIPPPSERYQLQLGMTWMMGKGIFVEPAVALRLGGSSPDLTESANLVLSY